MQKLTIQRMDECSRKTSERRMAIPPKYSKEPAGFTSKVINREIRFSDFSVREKRPRLIGRQS